MPAFTGDAVAIGRQLTDADILIVAGDDPDQLTTATVGDIFGSETGMQINDQLGTLTTDVGNLDSIVNDLIEKLGNDVQVVSGSTGTITTARHVIVTHTGSNCALTLPTATDGREITVWKATQDDTVEISLVRSADDITAGTTINAVAATLTLTMGEFGESAGASWRIVGRVGAWLVDPTWMTLAAFRDTYDGFASTITNALFTVLEGQLGYVTTVTGATHTVTTEDTIVVTYTGGTCVITLPPGTYTRRIKIIKAHTSAVGIELARDGSDVINGSGSNYTLPHSASANAFLGEWHAKAIFDGSPGQWAVSSWGTAIAANTSAIATNTADIATDAARITALEANTYAPSTLACTGASHSWTTEVEADVTYASGTCTIALDANTTQWPVGTSRVVNKLNTSSNTIVLDPQGTHTINGLAANTNVTLMNSANIPSGTVAAGIWRVKRLSSTAWWVQ